MITLNTSSHLRVGTDCRVVVRGRDLGILGLFSAESAKCSAVHIGTHVSRCRYSHVAGVGYILGEGETKGGAKLNLAAVHLRNAYLSN